MLIPPPFGFKPKMKEVVTSCINYDEVLAAKLQEAREINKKRSAAEHNRYQHSELKKDTNEQVC